VALLEVDLRDAIPQELIATLRSEDAISAMLDSVAASARKHWIGLAQDELRSSARAYIDAIQDVEVEETLVRSITLAAAWLPSAVESGVDEYDLRDTLLTSPKAKESKGGGKYMRVPFRHGTPDSLGHAGKPMGSSYGPPGMASRGLFGQLSVDHAREFGADIYRAAKALRGKQRLGEGTSGAPKLAPHHTTDIYTGMQRRKEMKTNERTGKASAHTQYMTFRTISTKNPQGWLHPGIEPRKFAERVGEHVQEVFGQMIAATMQAGSATGTGAPP
jgi:hypothetical protein